MLKLDYFIPGCLLSRRVFYVAWLYRSKSWLPATAALRVLSCTALCSLTTWSWSCLQYDWAVRYLVVLVLSSYLHIVRFPWKRSWCAAWWFFGCCGRDSAQACYLIYAGAVRDIFIKCLLGVFLFINIYGEFHMYFFYYPTFNKLLNKICSHNKVNYSAARWWSWRGMAGPSLSTLTRSLVG